MDIQAVRKRVEAIKRELAKGEKRNYGPDHEELHILEDSLYEDILKAIAEGRCENQQECAAEALKVGELDFSRWYA